MLMMVRSPTIIASVNKAIPMIGMIAQATNGCGVPRENLIACISINVDDRSLGLGELDKV